MDPPHAHSHAWVRRRSCLAYYGTCVGFEYHVEYHLFHLRPCLCLHFLNANVRLGYGTRTLTRVGEKAPVSGLLWGVTVTTGVFLCRISSFFIEVMSVSASFE